METSSGDHNESLLGKICLGIESTAHTFGVSIISTKKRGNPEILSDIRRIHCPPKGKGIHPREASRHHVQNAASSVAEALKESKISLDDIDIISFSQGPGLGPCLRVGAVVARSISSYYNKPLIPVNHAIAHIELAAMLTGPSDPLVLLVSGGHTVITFFAYGHWRIFGETLDITIGQLIDQFGRTAGFSSPFGRRFEIFAKNSHNYLSLPYTIKGNDVSFSGLLTASQQLFHKNKKLEDICFSIQETGFAMLAESVERALAFTEKEEFLIAGGVAANGRLQSMMQSVCKNHKSKFFSVPLNFSGDCGSQISWNGLQSYDAGLSVDISESCVKPSWRLDEVDAKWRN
ncbi:KEOPS complex N(6)-L-threonylcarbamoyladenine synthase Kae1 [Thermoproteota archaeon]